MVIANCKFCGKECQAGKGLAYHQNRCTQNPDRITPPIFQGSCKHCGKEYTSKSHLIVHENQCEKNPDRVVKSFPCGKCDRVFKNKQDLGNHLNRCGKEEIKEECQYCHGMYGNLKAHMKACSENPKNKRKCQHCGEMFDHREIERHERDCPHNPLVEMIDGTRHYLCPSEGCDYKHIHLSTVSKHHRFSCDKNPDREGRKKAVRKKVSLTCDLCNNGKVYESLGAFKTHQSRFCKKNPKLMEKMSTQGRVQLSSRGSFTEKHVHKFIYENVFGKKKDIMSYKIGQVEYDIMIEDKKVLIEFDGTFYHSSYPGFGVSKESHQFKTDLAEKSGWKLYHVSEHDWTHKKELWKAKLTADLNPSHESITKIGARKLKVKKINNFLYKAFLNKNHLQGYRNATSAYGLFLEDTLISMMSFQWNDKYRCQELIRFASQRGWIISGGAEKLFSFAKKDLPTGPILSYARRDWSSALSNVYQRLGFSEIGRTVPGYQYVHTNKIKDDADGIQSRQVFQKHKLLGMIERGEMEKPEGDLTEKTITEHNGWYRFYDAGNLIYMWGDPNEFSDKK